MLDHQYCCSGAADVEDGTRWQDKAKGSKTKFDKAILSQTEDHSKIDAAVLPQTKDHSEIDEAIPPQTKGHQTVSERLVSEESGVGSGSGSGSGNGSDRTPAAATRRTLAKNRKEMPRGRR